MQDAQRRRRQEVVLATHEHRLELRTTRRAVISLGIGIGLAAGGGWLLILMLVHLVHALTVPPLWACDGIVGRVRQGCSSSARKRWRSRIWYPRTQWKR
jgi:hypothetical protein